MRVSRPPTGPGRRRERLDPARQAGTAHPQWPSRVPALGTRGCSRRAQAFWPSRPPSQAVSAARAGHSGTCSPRAHAVRSPSAARRPLAGARRRGRRDGRGVASRPSPAREGPSRDVWVPAPPPVPPLPPRAHGARPRATEAQVRQRRAVAPGRRGWAGAGRLARLGGREAGGGGGGGRGREGRARPGVIGGGVGRGPRGGRASGRGGTAMGWAGSRGRGRRRGRVSGAERSHRGPGAHLLGARDAAHHQRAGGSP